MKYRVKIHSDDRYEEDKLFAEPVAFADGDIEDACEDFSETKERLFLKKVNKYLKFLEKKYF